MVELSFLPPGMEDYLLGFLEGRHPVLKEMEAKAREIQFDLGGGRMIPFPIAGPLVGALLAQHARMIGARRIFELGSGYGYSAFWSSQAMGPEGRVICTDGREDNRALALSYLGRAGLAARVDFRVGDALDILDREAGPFDIVFMDMEKDRYPLGLRAALPKLRKGGLLIADNVLWAGQVLAPARLPSTRGIQEFTRLALSSVELSTVIYPVRDGVSVSIKL